MNEEIPKLIRTMLRVEFAILIRCKICVVAYFPKCYFFSTCSLIVPYVVIVNSDGGNGGAAGCLAPSNAHIIMIE